MNELGTDAATATPAPGERADGARADGARGETYNPWTVVNIVFTHLAEQGLHPALGEGGDPGEHARQLLIALGIEPLAEGNREVTRRVHEHLAEIRGVFEPVVRAESGRDV